MDGSQQRREFISPGGVERVIQTVATRDIDHRPTTIAPWLVGASFLTILVPFLFAAIPPLVDYPNHLARFWLLAGGVKDPALAPFYLVDWTNASTNIGVDLAATFLSSIAPAFDVAHVAAVAAALLPPLGVLALNWQAFRRLTPWQALFPVAAWSTTFLMGFLNFQIGVGLALLFAAADPWFQRRLGRFAAFVRIPIALILAIDHLFAVLFYATLVAGLAIGPIAITWRSWRETAVRLRDAALAALWPLVALLPLAAFAPALPGSDVQATTLSYGNVLYRLGALLAPLAGYNIAAAVLLTLGLSGLAIWLRRHRALTSHAGLLLAGAGLVVATMVVPDQAGGGSWISRRLPTMALLAILAALQIKPSAGRRTNVGLGAAALILVFAQTVWISWGWHRSDEAIRSVRRVLAGVPSGAAVMPLQHEPTLLDRWNGPAGRYVSGLGDPTFRHFVALATPWRRAFVPTLFSARGLQPLQVQGAWNRYVEHNGGELASVSALGRPFRPRDPAYLKVWRTRFDYILVLNADMRDAAGAFAPPPGVELLSDGGFAQLWRIRRLPAT